MVNSIVNKFGKWIGVEGTFASWFVSLGIFTQLLTGYIMNDTALAVCSGIAGVISVVLCSPQNQDGIDFDNIVYAWSCDDEWAGVIPEDVRKEVLENCKQALVKFYTEKQSEATT